MEWLKSLGLAVLGLAAYGAAASAFIYGMLHGLPILLQSDGWKVYVDFIDWVPKPSREQFAVGLVVVIVFLLTYLVHGMRNDPYWGRKKDQ